MSQANIPNITPNISLTREESINLTNSSKECSFLKCVKDVAQR